ncbi:MAG: hypothetical protein CM1200mP20_13740 [Pseudomonadota bacterium]|nr:MAG: hypothetical protein CM1200mP20_13740 [Pseudomonadota bacterium]
MVTSTAVVGSSAINKPGSWPAPCDHDSLALTTGKLVRVSRQSGLGFLYVNQAQEFKNLLAGLLIVKIVRSFSVSAICFSTTCRGFSESWVS